MSYCAFFFACFSRFAGFTGGVLSIRVDASSTVNGWSETGISSFLRGLDMSSQTPIASGWIGDAEASASSDASASIYHMRILVTGVTNDD
jgi:hypothetical protein